MKIVFCIAGTYNSGGMERVLANKANYLVRNGYEVAIVTSDQKNRLSYFAMDDAIHQYDLGIDYVDYEQAGLLRKTCMYFLKQKKHRKKITILLQQLQADVVISMFDHDASFLYKVKDGSKKVLEIHFSSFKRLQYGRKGIWKLADKTRRMQDLRLARRYDRFVVLTEEDRAGWGDVTNIAVIPNANSFKGTAVADLAARRAIAVGRYDYQKGFDELIKVWKGVSVRHPDWKLDIFGQGPLQQDLEALIEELGLADSVRLCAPVGDIEKEYIQSSMLLMTSRYEGLPMALLEAQVCGLPMVAYSCKCGPKDIIDDGRNGFLLHQGDREQMMQRIVVLIENTDLRHRMGAEGRQMSLKYTEETVMEFWMNLFKNLVQ